VKKFARLLSIPSAPLFGSRARPNLSSFLGSDRRDAEMPAEIDPSFLEPLRGAAGMLEGLCRLVLALVARLEAAPAERESDALEEGAALLATELRCVVVDALDPALRSLEALIESRVPRPGSGEPEP
jgi:hypothetical protein